MSAASVNNKRCTTVPSHSCSSAMSFSIFVSSRSSSSSSSSSSSLFPCSLPPSPTVSSLPLSAPPRSRSRSRTVDDDGVALLREVDAIAGANHLPCHAHSLLSLSLCLSLYLPLSLCASLLSLCLSLCLSLSLSNGVLQQWDDSVEFGRVRCSRAPRAISYTFRFSKSGRVVPRERPCGGKRRASLCSPDIARTKAEGGRSAALDSARR